MGSWDGIQSAPPTPMRRVVILLTRPANRPATEGLGEDCEAQSRGGGKTRRRGGGGKVGNAAGGSNSGGSKNSGGCGEMERRSGKTAAWLGFTLTMLDPLSHLLCLHGPAATYWARLAPPVPLARRPSAKRYWAESYRFRPITQFIIFLIFSNFSSNFHLSPYVLFNLV